MGGGRIALKHAGTHPVFHFGVLNPMASDKYLSCRECFPDAAIFCDPLLRLANPLEKLLFKTETPF